MSNHATLLFYLEFHHPDLQGLVWAATAVLGEHFKPLHSFGTPHPNQTLGCSCNPPLSYLELHHPVLQGLVRAQHHLAAAAAVAARFVFGLL